MGMLTEDGQIKANVPSKDRSMFSQVRYQFFLDAPFEISQKCCSVMKKEPAHRYSKKTGRYPMTAQMASESRLRTQQWIRNGCNWFHLKNPMSNPMAFWTEQDVLLYLWKNKIPIATVYGDIVVDYDATGDIEGQMSIRDYGGEWELFDLDRPLLKTTGCSRTGCMFCGYGCHLEKPGEGRFERMKETHPKQYKYIMTPWTYSETILNPDTMEYEDVERHGLNYKEVIDWINEHGNMNIRY